MSQWQPQEYDPRRQQPQQQVAHYGQPPRPKPYESHRQPRAAAQPARKTSLTTAEGFWYIFECVAFGAGYLCKVPAKRALQDFGMAQMTAAEQFWYVLMCIAFGAGYFAKLPVSKALAEMPQFRAGPYR